MVNVLSMSRLPIACLVEVKLADHVDHFLLLDSLCSICFLTSLGTIYFSSLVVLINQVLLLL